MPSSLSFNDFSPTGGGRVCAVLGPTNTGKTHYALERMLAHKSGMIGLPLRLLAREIYDRIIKVRDPREVALVTGEEKIIPPNPRFWVATVEAMPLEREVEFLAIDEIQLAADPERGRIFTSRLLHARGRSETLFLGSHTMRPILQRLFGNIQFLARDRFSRLSYTGPKKATRLPRRSAIVAFSSDTVYAMAELIRRQRGGAAVVLGALSPRTRNAQAELYQSGEVDFLIATDAIGMGLNMDIDHVAFAASRKFDGRRPRNLTPSELAQIAGRAGRHVNDGTFGVTADCPAFDEELVQSIEDHEFDPVKALMWRSEQIDFSSLPALLRSLERPPPRDVFIRSRREDDEDALARLSVRDDIRDIAKGGAALATLWDICQIPDFRKVGGDQHARLLGDIYLLLMHDGRVPDSWLEPRIEPLNRTDGDIDALSARIAHIRTWTYLSHRAAWIDRAPYWQERARAIEDALSDALHEKLTQRFVDRRTSTLLKRLKDDAPLLAGVTDDGEVIVEGQFVGRLLGFEFIVDPRASGAEAKSLRAAGEKALRPVLAARAAALANAESEELRLDDNGAVWWRAAPVAQLKKGPTALRPDLTISGLAEITPNMRGRVEDRLKLFVASKIEGLLGPLVSLQAAANAEGDDALKGITKGVAYRLVENFGATSRTQFGDDLKQIDQTERGKLRKIGMRFGEFTLFMPALLKPAPASLLTLLWALWTDRKPGDVSAPQAGRVSIELNESLPHAYYYACGYRPSGVRAVRIDMLERLAGLIRTARNEGSREGFEATSQMMSLVGCSGEDFEAILRSLGFRKHLVKRKVEPKQDSTPKATDATVTHDGAAADGEQQSVTPVSTVENSAPEASNSEAPPEKAASQADVQQADAPAAEKAEQTSQPAPESNAESQDAKQTTRDETTPSAAVTEPEQTEIALWRLAPRRPKPAVKPAKRDAKGKGAHGKGQRGPKQGKGGKPRNQNQNRRPPREKKADPNSPFAVLAGLKAELSGAESGEKPKEPEKTE
ncbi:helicase-related protein [Hyphococcus flavus]|uniref:Helicase-related protein n=1 Tax=Hyphococcus flavus TaxID=1866326 RepID=A0AAF0CFQ6_9PROT|nr:helicase-related protein [Hyphococcus flavus]WDI31634.1 helicase-related protein [Hyphococcus flavus]